MSKNFKIFKQEENSYIEEILNEICNKYFSKKFDLLLNIEIDLISTKCLIKINDNFFHIKLSSVEDFIYKDYDISWILQDLNCCPKPIDRGFLKKFNLFYTIFEHIELNKLKYDLNLNSIKKIISYLNTFHCLKIDFNEKIETLNNFFLKKFNFAKFYYFFSNNLEQDFLTISCCYGEIYEKIKSFLNKGILKSDNILLHGNLNEKNIMLDNEDFAFLNFENAFYGDPSVDLCIFFINLKYSKKIMQSFYENRNEEYLNYISNVYDICFLKKALDFLTNLILLYINNEITSKDIIYENNIWLTFFSDIKEIQNAKKSILNIINHSSV